jgi:hypothetical protein
LFLPGNGLSHILVEFEVHQLGQVVLFREPFHDLVLVFPDPLWQVTGYANKKDSIRLVAKQVDRRLLLHRIVPDVTARIKQQLLSWEIAASLRSRQRHYKQRDSLVTTENTTLHFASKHDCDLCPLKACCCPNIPARKIARSVHVDARDEFLLAATAQNLRRMARWLGQPPPGHGLCAPA